MGSTLVLTRSTASKYLKRLGNLLSLNTEWVSIKVVDYSVSWWRRPFEPNTWTLTRSQAFRLQQFIQHEHAKQIKKPLRIGYGMLNYLRAVYPYKEANGK